MPSRLPAPSEHASQAAVFDWAEHSVKRYPAVRFLYAIPNGGHRNIVTAARMKKEGVKAGLPDIHLPVPNGSFYGLWIEMKRRGNRPTKEQAAWMEGLSSMGHKCAVCYSSEDAIDVIRGYLKP